MGWDRLSARADDWKMGFAFDESKKQMMASRLPLSAEKARQAFDDALKNSDDALRR